MSLETVVEGRLDNEKFHLLLDVLKILEKHNDPEVRESAMEIIESFDETMTDEQKAAVLKEFLNFNHHGDDLERKRRFEEEVRKQQMKEFRGWDYE